MAPKDIESLLPFLLVFPPHPPPPIPIADALYDKEIKNLRKLLNDTPANQLTSGVPNGGDLLDIIDPSINSLPFLYTLLAHFNAGKQKGIPVGGPLWSKALEFFERFDPVQIRYVGTEFRRLIIVIRDLAVSARTAISAIKPIRSAILRLDPSGACFTSTHHVFVRLCLEARAFRAAKPVIDQDIYEFPSSFKTTSGMFPCSHHDTSAGYITDKSDLSASMSYQEPLGYFLCGAMIYIALKDWQRAIRFLEIVLVAPSRNYASHFQVEAYKKWVLVNLLAHGRVPDSLPKTTSSQVAKQLRTLGKPYEALGDIFRDGLTKENDVRRLNAEIHVGNQKWSADNNLSIVIQTLDAYRQFAIIKLASLYSALPLPEVTLRTSPSSQIDHTETAHYITNMIQNGLIHATLDKSRSTGNDPQSWVICFSDTNVGATLTEQQQYEELTKQAARTAKLANHVRESDRKLALSKEYINWMRQAKNDSGGGTMNDGNESTMLPGQHPFDDEDIMGDG
ncbi:MAG: hypothetical protein Q9222_003489 [Ikaeria aurantiellina]